MKYPRWVPAVVAGFSMTFSAGAGDPYSIRDVDSSPVQDLSLDMTRVELFQSEDHYIVFRVTFASPPAVERLRIMLDVDGAAHGEPASGADYMLEGSRFYRYPEEATDWTWDAIEPPFLLVVGSTVTCLLPDLPHVTRVRWFVETTKPDWSTADRLPQVGMLEFARESLPKIELQTKLFPEDIGEWMAEAPTSLCFRLNADLKSRFGEESSSAEKPMAWKPVMVATSLPLRIVLSDTVTHESMILKPDKTFAASNSVEWTGKSMGIDWVMLMEPLENGDVRLTGQLQAAVERCVRVGVGCELNLNGWTWHDDVRFRRPIQSPELYANVVPCPFGARGDRSMYPFGVISSDNGSLIAETDAGEPRIYQIVADARDSLFGVFYDFGLTSLTSNFPGRAAFRCVLRSSKDKGDNAFRRALAEYYDRNPDTFRRTVPVVGVWLPFTDPNTISNVGDFGFAFYVAEEGNRIADADRELLAFGYTEPWLYRLPMPRDIKRTEDGAVQRMKFLAAADDRRAELAASALLGAARRPDGSICMEFLDEPRNSGARLEVSADPHLSPTADWPLNRAMSEWREAKRVLATGSQGIFLDSVGELRAADYSPAAMAVADYPCVYERKVLKPCLSMEWSGYEYTAALSRALKARGKFILGHFVRADSPFFVGLVDVVGEEIEWEESGLYGKFDDRAMNFRRAMSGRKPNVMLLNASFDKLTADSVRQYFESSMFWGFLPGFFSEDGFHQRYWENPKWYERDRALFKTYVPLIQRLALGGWQAAGGVKSSTTNVWVECFDDTVPDIRHITLRNTTATPARAMLNVEPSPEPLLLINPLVAGSAWIESNKTQFPVALAASAIEMRDLVPVPALNRELEFARSWKSGAGENAACVKVLESILAELNLGALCDVSCTAPAVPGETNLFHLVIRNHGKRRLEVGELKIITTKQFRPFDMGWKTVEPGEDFLVNGFYSSDDMGKNPWLEAQWTLRDGATEVVCTRMIHPRYSEEDLRLFRSRVRR
jgi:hypothetical protein